MDEGRKRVLLIAASILAARKLAQYDGGKRVPATMCAIADAVKWAEEIDEHWPVKRKLASLVRTKNMLLDLYRLPARSRYVVITAYSTEW